MQMENSPNTTILKFALGGHNKKIHTHPVSPFLKKKKKKRYKHDIHVIDEYQM